MLSQAQIDKNVGWLLKRGSPPVKYQTYKYILGADPDSPEMRDLWAEVEASPDVADIFSKQQPDGSWCCGGKWAAKPAYSLQDGYEPTTPKYATTAWILPLLGDMGFDRSDPRIRRACNYTLTYQWKNGFFGNPRSHAAMEMYRAPRMPNIPCHFALYLLAFSKVGMGADDQLKKSYDLLARWQRDDGGWVDERHGDGSISPYIVWDRSCPWSTFHAASAMHCSKNPDYIDSARRGLKFLLWHLSTKADDHIRRFFYHGHSVVTELLMFSEAGIGMAERPVKIILDWLMTMYRADKGHFKYTGKPISKYSTKTDGISSRVLRYRLFHLIEDDWLTYYMTRIARNIISPAAIPEVAAESR